MRLLLVEDEPELATAIVDALRASGWGCDLAETLGEAAYHLELHDYDLIVLDRRLPDGDGLDACRQWRADGLTKPVLVLTAMTGSDQVVAGLGAGADDYLGKPFATDELVARIQALLRRAPVAPRPLLRFGALEIDRGQRRVRLAGDVLPLTGKEFALLEILALAAPGVVDRLELLERCWDHAYEPGSNVVDVHVGSLRRKLGPGLVETVRGAGYRLAEPGT